MRELSLHIMDVVENGLSAGARLITVAISEEKETNLLKITISDDGRGMSEEMLAKAVDPFFTTRTTRRVGLGLSLFREAARRCGGEFHIRSREGEGTEVSATFRMDHIDLAPLGEISNSMAVLIMGHPDVDFLYMHKADDRSFRLDTRELKRELEGVPIHHPEVIRYLKDLIRESLAEIDSRSGGS